MGRPVTVKWTAHVAARCQNVKFPPNKTSRLEKQGVYVSFAYGTVESNSLE